jgi:hypothetical protein
LSCELDENEGLRDRKGIRDVLRSIKRETAGFLENMRVHSMAFHSPPPSTPEISELGFRKWEVVSLPTLMTDGSRQPCTFMSMFEGIWKTGERKSGGMWECEVGLPAELRDDRDLAVVGSIDIHQRLRLD